MKRPVLTILVAVLVISAILVLDPTLRPRWLDEIVGSSFADPQPANSETALGSPGNGGSQLEKTLPTGMIEPKVAPRVGEAAPDFALRTMNGDVVRLTEFRGEKFVVLNFWATWCAPCVIEMPELDAVARENQAELVVLGINNQESRDVVANFLRDEVNISFPILLDFEGEVTSGYNVFAQPTTMFVDKQGNFAPINSLPGKFGAFTAEELRQRIDELLSGSNESEPE